MIPSVEWVEVYKLKLIRFEHLRNDFLKTKVTELVNKMIVDPIIEEMRDNNVSRKIWERVRVDEVNITNDGIHIKIISDFDVENEYGETFDVALAREEGTDDHMIRPRRKQSLSWIQGGKRRFSGGHMVSGLPRLNIIERMVERHEYALQQSINEEFRKWKREVFS